MENLRIVMYPSPKGTDDKFRMVVYPERTNVGGYVFTVLDRKNKGGYVRTGDNDVRFSESLSRTKRLCRDYAFCNEWDYFCTFTFDKKVIDRYSFADCRKSLTKFFNNYRNRKSKDFRYLIVPELHEDGAIHFHGLVKGINDLYVPDTILCRDKKTDTLIEVPNTKKYMRWSSYNLGNFDCSKIKSHEKVCNYLVKYINKDVVKNFSHIPYAQLLLHSQGLKTPVAVYDTSIPYWDVCSLINKTLSNKAKRLKFEYCDVYQNMTYNDFENIINLFR